MFLWEEKGIAFLFIILTSLYWINYTLLFYFSCVVDFSRSKKPFSHVLIYRLAWYLLLATIYEIKIIIHGVPLVWLCKYMYIKKSFIIEKDSVKKRGWSCKSLEQLCPAIPTTRLISRFVNPPPIWVLFLLFYITRVTSNKFAVDLLPSPLPLYIPLFYLPSLLRSLTLTPFLLALSSTTSSSLNQKPARSLLNPSKAKINPLSEITAIAQATLPR